jgi:hypothetical protein
MTVERLSIIPRAVQPPPMAPGFVLQRPSQAAAGPAPPPMDGADPGPTTRLVPAAPQIWPRLFPGL